MIGDLGDIENKFTKYEIARILGARALQLAMDAPLLIKIDAEELERIRYDPLRMAEIELKHEVLPITIRRPMPTRAERDNFENSEGKKEDHDKVDEKIAEREREEEEEIAESGEIMELANPDDEREESSSSDERENYEE